MLTYGGTEAQGVTYNGAEVEAITYNGTEVWVAAKPNLEDNSWATIKKVSQNGKAANYWSVGATKDVYINGTFGGITVNGTYKAVIIGINHNASTEGNKVHFAVIKNSSGAPTAFTNVMYSIYTPQIGWEDCTLRTQTLVQFKNALPAELQSAIGSVKKFTNGAETTESIFVPSEIEIVGDEAKYESAYGQSQYSYWQTASNRLLGVNWWTRTIAINTEVACFLQQERNLINYGQVTRQYGFVPCFTI